MLKIQMLEQIVTSDSVEEDQQCRNKEHKITNQDINGLVILSFLFLYCLLSFVLLIMNLLLKMLLSAFI